MLLFFLDTKALNWSKFRKFKVMIMGGCVCYLLFELGSCPISATRE